MHERDIKTDAIVPDMMKSGSAVYHIGNMTVKESDCHKAKNKLQQIARDGNQRADDLLLSA